MIIFSIAKFLVTIAELDTMTGALELPCYNIFMFSSSSFLENKGNFKIYCLHATTYNYIWACSFHCPNTPNINQFRRNLYSLFNTAERNKNKNVKNSIKENLPKI